MGSHLNMEYLGVVAGAGAWVPLGLPRASLGRTTNDLRDVRVHLRRPRTKGRACSERGRQRGPIQGFDIGFSRLGMLRPRPPSLMACGCDEVALDLKIILAEGKLSDEATYRPQRFSWVVVLA